MKKYILIFGAVICFVLAHLYYYNYKTNEIRHLIYEEKTKEIKNILDTEIYKKLGKSLELTYILSKSTQVLNALKDNDTKRLDYTEIIKELTELGEYKHLWILVTDAKGRAFYRSWTKKLGDDVSKSRPEIRDIMKNHKPKKLISVARFDLTFKTMVPIMEDGKYLGAIELISKFNSIATYFQSLKIEPLIVVHEKYTKLFIKPFSNIFIGNNYVANINASKEIIQLAQNYGLKKLMYPEDLVFVNDYFVSTQELKDENGEEMAFFIFFTKKNNIEKEGALNHFYLEYTIKLLVNIILIALIYMFIDKRNYYKTLDEEVKKKTRQLHDKTEKLQKLLEAYDKNVIFSTTDLKGIITQVSTEFCEISGYTKEELIGKNHNIVRHPDMPKEAFKNLWQTIQKGQTWSGNVKNRKKDGSYYWVKAEIEPVFEDGKIVEYIAVRQDITALLEIDKIQKDVIFTIGSIGERRSLETGHHVKRVAEYSRLLALKLGFSVHDAQMIAEASPMHDIGKVAIPDSILNKPGKLTDEEMEIMKTHSTLGYEMLRHSDTPLLKTAAIIAVQHHEKWDGSGYPEGLKGEEIHICGRITALADVFDALGSDRCYKKAWEDEKIFQFIKEQRGKHFDPKIVDIFFENLDQFLSIRKEFSFKLPPYHC